MGDYFQYGGFNSDRSAIRQESERGFDPNIIYETYLSDDNKYTPIDNNLQQEYTRKDNGGLHNISFGFAHKLNEMISFGLSVNSSFGEYGWVAELVESDVKNIYNNYDVEDIFEIDNISGDTLSQSIKFNDLDFNSFWYQERINQEIYSLTATLSVLVNLNENSRMSLAVRLPQTFNINQTFDIFSNAKYDNGDFTSPEDFTGFGNIDYTLSMPMKIMLATSYNISNLTLSGAFEFSDYSQMEYRNSEYDNQLNLQISKELTGKYTWSIGSEYKINSISTVIRASASGRNKGLVEGDENILSYGFGLGFFIGKGARLDLGSSFSRFNQYAPVRLNEGRVGEIINDKILANISLGLTYRY